MEQQAANIRGMGWLRLGRFCLFLSMAFFLSNSELGTLDDITL